MPVGWGRRSRGVVPHHFRAMSRSPNISQGPKEPARSTPSIGARCIAFALLWSLAILAFEIFLMPEGLTETDLSAFQQRVSWPLYTPVMASLGLARALVSPWYKSYHTLNSPFIFAGFLIAAGCFLVISISIFLCRNWRYLVLLVSLHGMALTFAVVYYMRIIKALSNE